MSGVKGMRWTYRRNDAIGKAGHDGVDYAVLADAYGLTRDAVAQAVCRYRKRLRAEVRS